MAGRPAAPRPSLAASAVSRGPQARGAAGGAGVAAAKGLVPLCPRPGACGGGRAVRSPGQTRVRTAAGWLRVAEALLSPRPRSAPRGTRSRGTVLLAGSHVLHVLR